MPVLVDSDALTMQNEILIKSHRYWSPISMFLLKNNCNANPLNLAQYIHDLTQLWLYNPKGIFKNRVFFYKRFIFVTSRLDQTSDKDKKKTFQIFKKIYLRLKKVFVIF
jgi:hypothetical protein